MKAKSAAVTTWTIADLDVSPDAVGLAGSSTQVIKVFFPERVSQAEILEGDLETKVDTLIERLRSAKLC
jgi:electron transfer flavoprotein beta subunit